MDGWNENLVQNLVSALEEANRLLYEINCCQRGVYSGAHTYEELGEEARKIAKMIETGAEDCDCIYDEEEEE